MSAIATLLGLADIGPRTDENYTGESSDSLLSLDYYRSQVTKFQDVMNALDGTIKTLGEMRALIPEQSTEMIDQWESLWNEAIDKRWQFRTAAQAINLAAEGLNAIDVRFPELSIPQTLQGLGFAPLALAGIAAAVAGAAALITWGNNYITSVRAWAQTREMLALLPEEKQQEWAQKTLELQAQESVANGSPLSNIAVIIKWLAIAGVGYFAYQAFMGYRGKGD